MGAGSQLETEKKNKVEKRAVSIDPLPDQKKKEKYESVRDPRRETVLPYALLPPAEPYQLSLISERCEGLR